VADSNPYVIRGGVAGRERLRTLARVMHPTTAALLDTVGIAPGLRCLDAGCGGGDVTQELARRVGPDGAVVGVDFDETKLALAREDAARHGLTNVEFRQARVGDDALGGPFDLVYSRFLLTHLPDPDAAVAQFHHCLHPGGRLVLEDIDFTGYFAYPASAAHRRYHDLYTTAVRRHGADPDIGPKLPLMLKRHGFSHVQVAIVQPMALEGDAKLVTPMTMENIRAAVVGAGLATDAEVDALAQQLHDYAADPESLAGMPRVVQAWGLRG
jgi:ubiquinone/menaquinone biosynthesis C-methylase UbiE